MVFFNLKKNEVDFTKDILNINIDSYNKFWNQLINYLKSDEPTTRFFALNYIVRIKEKLCSVLTDQNIAVSVFKAIYSISTSDESEKLRHLANFLLPLCINYQVTDQFKELVFQKVLTEFLQYYPKDLNNAQNVKEFIDEISSPEVKHLKKYIYLIRDLSHVLQFPQAKHPSFQAYVDRLFELLLNQNINIYIQSEVFYNIYMNYSVTNGNRLRFERFLRNPIIELGEHIKFLTSLYTDTDSQEDLFNSITPAKVSNKKTNENTSNTLPRIPPIIKYWRSQYYGIWKVWFLRPSDNDILLYDCSQLKIAGYAVKRKEQLFKYVRQNNDGSLEAKLEVELPYKLNTQPSLDYYLKKIEENNFYFDRKNRKKVLIKESDNEKININMLKEINDSLKKKNEYLMFKPVPLQSNKVFTLEIEIDNKVMVFDQFPFVKKFYLKNKSFSKVKYQFQVYPFESFTVEPSYGELLPKKKVQVTIKYIYNNRTFNSSSNVNGFLRLRNSKGYPIERINLIGISLPSIKINTKELDFGMIPPNTKRMNFFVIKNLKRDVNICNIFILEKGYSSMFTLSEKKVIIEKMDSKIITLTLITQNHETINCKCAITTKMGEIYFINLKAVCGYSISIDKKINFGPTDIYYRAASKRITVENKDPLYPLSVPFITSTKEIIVNENQQVMLHPNERKQIKVDFNSLITGSRSEFIGINNPITDVKTINVNAISGPIVLIPVFDEIGFPLTFPFSKVVIQIPLINVINEKARCLISLPKNTPFNVSLADSEIPILTHNNTDNTVKALFFEIKEKSTVFINVTYCSWTQGLFRVNLNFELEIPYKLHLYTIVLSACCVSKSRKSYDNDKLIRIRKFFNNRFDCPAFKGTEPDNIESMYKDNSSKVLTLPSQFTIMSKQIFMEEEDETAKEERFKKLFSENDNTENNNEQSILKNSGIIVSYNNNNNNNNTYLINKKENNSDDESDYEDSNKNERFSATLYNNVLILKSKSETDQVYHIFISGPFITDVPLDGVIKRYSYLLIPLYIDYKRFSHLINKENFYFTCYGHISIMDENSYSIGSLYTLLQGFNNTMIDLEVGKKAFSPQIIEFPVSEQNQKTKKTIYLRNKSNYEIEFNVQLSNIENLIYNDGQRPIEKHEEVINENEENKEIKEDNKNEEVQYDNSVFVLNKLSHSNIIKPFEIIPLEISCLSSSMGSFKSILKISYNSPNIFSNSISENKREDDNYATYYNEISKIDVLKAKFKAPSVIFSTIIGNPDINISKELLYFGDITIGNSRKKDIMVINKGIPVEYYFYSLSPYIIQNNKLLLNPKGKENNIIMFEGKQTGMFNSYMIMKYNNNIDFMPVSGYCGKMKLKTNIGQLIKNIEGVDLKNNFWEHSDLALDYNCIEFSKFKSMEFTIYNKGTVDFSLIDVISSNDNIITWHVKEDKQDNSNILFNSKLLSFDNNICNKTEYYNKIELDWDEISYVMDKQNSVTNRIIKNNENDKSNFPIMVLPNESVKLILTAWGYKEGKFKETIDFFIDIGNNCEIYTLFLKGDISHPLSLKTKNVEFGIVHVNKTSDIQQIMFNNDSNRSFKWWIEFIETKYNILNAKKRKEDKEAFSSIIHPFTIFPDKGEIGAKKSQDIEIKFTPNIPQCDIETKVVIRTNVFDKLPFRLHGIGGSVILKASLTNIDFGYCAVGSKQVIPITISNVGLLYSKFTTECTSNCFKVDPEFGVIKNGETIIIRISYIPLISDEVNKGYFKLIPDNSTINKPVYVSLSGMSGYPDIIINKRLIDFGYTVWRGKNVKTLIIQNKGSVPGILNFTSKHSSLFIEEIDETECITIEPKSKRKLHVIYIPTKMEILNTHGIFSNIKYKTESILINFKGIVCQPKLVIDPPDFYTNINFGICHVNNVYEKKIYISNEGTIDLHYSLKFDFEQKNEYDSINSDSDENTDDDDIFEKDNNKIIKEKNVNINNGITSSKNSLNEDSKDDDTNDLFKIYNCPFTLTNNECTLPVGEKTVVIIRFSPTENITYNFNYSLSYGFQPVCGSVSGIGGIGRINFYPKVNSINFGLCHEDKETIKKIYIKNTGNISEKFIIRPVIPDTPEEIYNKDIASLSEFNNSEDIIIHMGNKKDKQKIENNEETKSKKNLLLWEKYLESIGLKLLNYDGICNPDEEKTIEFIYKPLPNTNLNVSFKLYTRWKSKEILIIGRSGKSMLRLCDMDGNEISPKKGVRFGMKSVDTINKIYLKLENMGDFGIDFMVNKSIKKIFEVNPDSGFIPPHSSFTLIVYYHPKEENIFKWNLDIMWEKGVISVPVSAKSGTGKINITFPENYEDNISIVKESLDENTYLMKFNPIPLHSYAYKKFFIYNNGIVGVNVGLKVTGEVYSLSFTSEVQKYSVNKIGAVIIGNNKKGLQGLPNSKHEWKNELESFIPSKHYVEVTCRFYAENEFSTKERIFINSNCFHGKINLSGRGGTIVISHIGDLEFNNINARYTYIKSVTLKNIGSIDTKISFKWAMSSHKHYKIISPGKIQFTNSFDNDDPRSEVIRNYIIVRNKLTSNSKDIMMSLFDENKKYENVKMTSKIYWEILRLNIISRCFDDDSNKLIEYMHELKGNKTIKNFVKSFEVAIELISKHRFKRKKNLFKYIENSPITSQSITNIQPYMRVLPEEILLPANKSVTVHVDLNLEHEMDYIATLRCISNFSIIEEYLIPLIANPKQISILCDMSKIDFSTQGIGETEVVTKEFRNIGKDINYTITSNNEGLKIIPDEGILKKGESVIVKFIFQPITEHIQSFPIIFQPECSQPIRIQFFGAGGYPQMSLKNGSTYEFGNCVIGKKLDVYLPIENKGTADLKVNNVILYSNGSFTEGPEWPNKRICIKPKETYRLPLIFKPESEQPTPATVSIITPLENYEINLSGVGKDAMIIISSLYLEFNDCIIGNQYEQKVMFRNTGDVIYPVKMELNDILPGIKFLPDNFSIMPFSTFEVGIQFKPTVEINKNIFVDVNSPYSKNQIRLKLHSGYVKLLIEKSVFNFGMFEVDTEPKMKFDIKNVGTIGTHYSIVHRGSNSNIQFTNRTGFIKPNDYNTVKMSYTNPYKHFGPFTETFDIKSDLFNSVVSFKVIGDCNHALIHPQEINNIDLGLCPIFESTKKSITLKNYGKFPLTFKMKVVYPIQCNVTKGYLNGGESQVIKFSWMPTGGYLLHSTATLSSNAGNYILSIVGKGTLPKIDISTEKIDYGICALNCTYEKVITISNVGLVKFKWSIQQQTQDFELSVKEGELNIKESIDVIVRFTPKGLKCYQSCLNIECKGLTNREIQLVGVGGTMKFYISPRIVDLGLCPKGLLTSGSFTIKSKGEVTIYSNFTEGKSINPNNILMVPKPVVLAPGKSVICRFDIIPYDDGPFEYNLIISTKEKTYRIKIKGSSKEIQHSPTIVKILEETKNLINIDPLKNYEFEHYDIFEIQINSINKKIYEDKEMFNIIEDKVNEINYLITGNIDFIKNGKNQTQEYRKYKYIPNRKRFSVFKTPIVVANIPTRKKSTMKSNIISNNLIIEEHNENNNNDKSLNYIKEKIFNKNQRIKSKLGSTINEEKVLPINNSNIISVDDISRSHILINSPSTVVEYNNNQLKKSTSDGNILSNKDDIKSESNAIKFSNSKNSTMHCSLLTLNKNILSAFTSDEMFKEKCNSMSIPYIKDDEITLSNRREMLMNKLLQEDDRSSLINKDYTYSRNSSYLLRSPTRTSIKDKLINKKGNALEKQKEFIDQIKNEFIEYKVNKNSVFTKQNIECKEDDIVIKSIIDYPMPKVNNNNINYITEYVIFDKEDNLDEVLRRPIPFKVEDNNDNANKVNIKCVDFNEEKNMKLKRNNKKNLKFRTIDYQYKKKYENNVLIYIPKKNSSST